ncbi:MAG TPA: creatininase family protein [Aggregatilineaceae bacterium]|nr:creatininase family protein [Aggregatilineaceae bacterium]
MRTVRFEQLRPSEIIAERERYPVVFQPLGPLEWHGPHLPVGTDPLHAEAVACRVAEQSGGVVMPTLFWGTERERSPQALQRIGFRGDEWIIGMDFPPNTMPSLYSAEDIFGVVVRARLDLLVQQNYRLVVMVNGHGATNHITVLDRLAAEFTARGPAQVQHLIAFSPEPNGEYQVGHADAIETSLMMALYPHAVDLTTLPDQSTPLRNVDWAIVDAATFGGKPTDEHTVAPENDPRVAASEEKGNDSLARSVQWIQVQVQKALGMV